MNLISKLMAWWCRTFHDGVINRTSTSYECPTCHRVCRYDWWEHDEREARRELTA